MGQTASYSFAENYITITLPQALGGNTYVIGGYEEGSDITVNRANPVWTLKESPDGKFMTRVKNSSKSHTVVFTLMSTSPANDVLGAIAAYDASRNDDAGMFTCTFANKTGRDVFTSNQAFIVTPETHNYGADSTTREWTIHLPNADSTIGGSAKLTQEVVNVLEALGVTVDPRWIM